MSSTEARVRAASKKKANSLCVFSGEVNANYAVIWEAQSFGGFCCEKVVNQLRELNLPGLRVKGVSMAVFTEKEVELLEVRGGRVASAVTQRAVSRAPEGLTVSPPHNTLPVHLLPPGGAGSRAATRRSAPCGGRTLTPRKRRA